MFAFFQRFAARVEADRAPVAPGAPRGWVAVPARGETFRRFDTGGAV